jgi:hypothetical protein
MHSRGNRTQLQVEIELVSSYPSSITTTRLLRSLTRDFSDDINCCSPRLELLQTA